MPRIAILFAFAMLLVLPPGATRAADDTLTTTIKNHVFMSHMRDLLRKWETSSRAYLHDGETPKVGSILKQPDLARTFRTIVDGGIDAF